MHMAIGAEAALFPEKEYISGIFVAVYIKKTKCEGVSGLSQTNLTLPWTNRRNSSAPVALRYFAQLDLSTVRALHAIYRIDFLMFDYDVEPYFQLFQP
jgi:hypothetical protein